LLPKYVDIATRGLAGEYYNAPIHEVLGGSRTRLPAYVSTPPGDEEGGLGSPEAMADFAEKCLDLEYPAFKHHSWMTADRDLDRQSAVDRDIEEYERSRNESVTK
jgi:L-alanine-DL-glutamate epimerase-like enolase superfamily enzyme